MDERLEARLLQLSEQEQSSESIDWFASLFRKDKQQELLNNPHSLIKEGYIDDTPLMNILANDIEYCHYSYLRLNISDNLFTCGDVDYQRLRQILIYEYGLIIDVEFYLSHHRLYRLMKHVGNHISEDWLNKLLERDQVEQQLRKELFQLLSDCCPSPPRGLGSNPFYADIDYAKAEEKLYRQYHIILSHYDRRELNTFSRIIDHIVFRMRNGGRI